MRVALILAAAAIAVLSAPARAISEAPLPEFPDTATVWEAGRYLCSEGIPTTSPDGMVGSVVEDCVLMEQGSVIRPTLGESFGCRMTLPGMPGSALIDVETQWRFPEPGIPHPVTREALRSSNWTWDMIAGGDFIALYRFDYPGELVEGVWSMEARFEGRAIASCCFNVTSDPGAQSSSPIAACTTPTS